MGTPCFLLIAKYYSGDPIENNGMDRWLRNVTFMGKRKGVYKVLVWKREGDYLEDLSIDEMILKWIFKRSIGWFWTALIRRR